MADNTQLPLHFRIVEQKLSAEINAVRERLESFKELINQRWAQSNTAKDLAVSDVNRRLTEMNELRAQLATERQLYVPRDYYDKAHQRLADELRTIAERIQIEHAEALQQAVFDAFMKDFYAWRDSINLTLTKFVTNEMADRDAQAQDDRIKTLENATSNFQGRMWMLGAAVTMTTSFVVIAVEVVMKFWK